VSSFIRVLVGGVVVASLVAAGPGTQVRAAPTTARQAGGAAVAAVRMTPGGTPAAAPWIVTTFAPPDQPASLQFGSLSASGKTTAWGLGEVTRQAGRPYSVVFRWQSKWRHVRLPARVVRASPFSVIGSSSPSNVWLLGGAKAPAVRWDGSRWTAGTLPLVRGHTPTITASAVLNSSNAWAFGGCCGFPHPYIAHLTRGTWQLVRLPAAIANLAAIVWGVSVVSSTDIWVLAQNRYGDYPKAQMLHWNGRRWYRVNFPAELVANQPHSILATSATSVWIGARSANGSGGKSEVLWHWDGTTWTSDQVPSALAGATASTWYVKSVIRDGRGGLWLLGQETYPGPDQIAYRIWHLGHDQWTGPQWISPSLPITVQGLAAVPGTTSYFAYGSQTNPPTQTEILGTIAQHLTL
jgi:hypothetical protein